MRDDAVKAWLIDELRFQRNSLARKCTGLSEYDARRPLTPTGTNLLGLVKHCALWESRYLGGVFGRPFAERLPPWDDVDANRDYFWVRADETREGVLGLYARVGAHSDGTIRELPLDAAGRVPWWADPDVTLILIIANQFHETARQAGHADILRELIGVMPETPTPGPARGHGRSAA